MFEMRRFVRQSLEQMWGLEGEDGGRCGWYDAALHSSPNLCVKFEVFVALHVYKKSLNPVKM